MRGLQKYRGYTLIELMIVVVILGVLASVAVPTYTQYVQSSRRADAKLALLQLSNQMEKYYGNNLAYVGTFASIGISSVSPDSYYTLSITLQGPGYLLTATPPNDSTQKKDTDCQTFTLNSSGERIAKNGSGTEKTDTCW